MTLNLSVSQGGEDISVDALRLNLTKKGNVNTSGMKHEHNSDPKRLTNLKSILDDKTVKDNLRKKGINYDMSGNVIFSIQHSKKSKTELEIRDIGDFYSMLKKYQGLFLPDTGNPPFYGDVYEVDEKDSRESSLFAAFLHEYSDSNGDFLSEFEHERESIDTYREARLQAINDTLSHSGEFISGQNKAAIGENPFYDMLIDDPKLKKKCIILANKCGHNPLFIDFIQNNVIDGNKEIVFFEFIEKLNTSQLDTLATLFGNENFASVMQGIFTELPGSLESLNKIIELIQDEKIKGNIMTLFYSLTKNGVVNTIIFLRYAGVYWKRYFESNNSVFITLLNEESPLCKEFINVLGEIAILPTRIRNLIVQDFSNSLALYLDIYMMKVPTGARGMFVTNLGYVFEKTNNKQHIVWLERTYRGIENDFKFQAILNTPDHVIEMLNKGKNPISCGKTFFGYPDYDGL